jgi:hypothetical protein
LRHEFKRPRLCAGSTIAKSKERAFRNLITDPHQRIQGRHWILEDHTDCSTAKIATLCRVKTHQIKPVEYHVPCDNTRRRRQQAYDGAQQCTFS